MFCWSLGIGHRNCVRCYDLNLAQGKRDKEENANRISPSSNGLKLEPDSTSRSPLADSQNAVRIFSLAR